MVEYTFQSFGLLDPYPHIRVSARSNPPATSSEWVVTYQKDPVLGDVKIYARGTPAFLGYISGLLPLTTNDYNNLSSLLATGI
jgi:hypothetical protein